MMQSAVWDYRNPYEYLSRAGKTDFPPLMITCAITGEFFGKEYNENFPETIDEQVEAVYQAYQEGATAVHIHARDPQHPARPSAPPRSPTRRETARAPCRRRRRRQARWSSSRRR